MKLEKIFINDKENEKEVSDSNCDDYVDTENESGTESESESESNYNSDKEKKNKIENFSKKSEVSTTIEFEKFIKNKKNPSLINIENVPNAKIIKQHSLVDEMLKLKKNKNCDSSSRSLKSSSSSSSSSCDNGSCCDFFKLIIELLIIVKKYI